MTAHLRSSGGSLPFARNVYQASFDFGEDKKNGDPPGLTLALDTGDATMVDLATPASPKIVTPGVYAFTVTGQVAPGGADAWYAGLLVDDNYYSLTARHSQVPSGDSYGFFAGCVVWWCDANDPFAVQGVTTQTPATDHFAGILYVQRIA